MDLNHVETVLQKWDPIGVIETLKEDGLPPNEYDSYAPPILSMLAKGADVEKIAAHLGRIQTVDMGLGGPWPEKDNQIAEELTSWWQSKHE